MSQTEAALIKNGSVTADDLASTLDLSGKTVTLPSGTGGKILQVVQGTTATPTATNSTTLVDTGLSASIQPVAAGSSVIAIVNQSVRIWGGIYQNVAVALLRGSTKVWGDNGSVSSNQYYNETGSLNQYNFFYVALNYEDSPTYTLGDTITYKTQARRSANDVQFQYENHQSTMILLEVAA